MYHAVALLMALVAAEPADCVPQPGVSENLMLHLQPDTVVEIDGRVTKYKGSHLTQKVSDCTYLRLLDRSTGVVIHEQHIRFVDGAKSVFIDLDRLGRDVPPLAAVMPTAEHCRLPQWARRAPSLLRHGRLPSELCPAGVAELSWRLGHAALLDGRPDDCVRQLRRVLALAPNYEPSKGIDSELATCIASAREGFDAAGALNVTVRDFRQDEGDLVVRMDVRDVLDIRPTYVIYAEAAGPRYDDSFGEQEYRRRARRTPLRFRAEGLPCTEAYRSFRDCAGTGNVALRFPDLKGPTPYEYRLVALDPNGDHLLQQKLPTPSR